MYDPKPIDMSEALRQVYEGKKLDPVGQEDKDIDNDGDHDKSDKYLLNRRKVRGAAIKTRKEEVEQFVDSLDEQQLDEFLDAVNEGVLGGLGIGAAALAAPYLMKKFGSGPANKAIDAGRKGLHLKGSPIGGEARGAAIEKAAGVKSGYLSGKSKGGQVKKEENIHVDMVSKVLDEGTPRFGQGTYGKGMPSNPPLRNNEGQNAKGPSPVNKREVKRVPTKLNTGPVTKEELVHELSQLSEEQLNEIIGGLVGGLMNMGKKGGFMKGASTGIGGLAGQAMGKKPTAKGLLGFSKGGKVKKESLAFSEEEEFFINEECNFDDVSDEELVAFFENAILEIAEDEEDLFEICEELEICGILMEEEEGEDKDKKKSVMDRLKSAAAKAGERLKAGAKAVIGAGGRAIGHGVGEFQAQRKKSKKAAMQRGDSEKKKSDDDGDKTGGKLDDILSSIRGDARGKSDSGGSSESSGGGGSKKPTFIQRVGGVLKGALKKGVGKLSRAVSKGSDKLASRLGESYDDIAHLYESGLFTIQEIENVIEEGYKEIDKKKENEMYRKAGNLARKSLSADDPDEKEKARKKSGKIVSAIARQKERERFSKMGDEKARDNYGG